MLFKNAAQKIHVYAYDSTTGAAKTGDQAQITAYVSLDGVANAVDDTNPAQVDATNMPGVYVFDLTAAETNCDSFALYAKSSTSNIRLEPIIGFTSGLGRVVAAGVVAARTTEADFTLTSADLSANNDDYNNMWLVFTTGNNRFLCKLIGDYVGGTKQVLFTGAGIASGFPQLVVAGDAFQILAGGMA
jgi:hypothetical protein